MERELEAWAKEAVCARQQQEMPLEDEGLPHLSDKDIDSATLFGEQRQAVLGAMSGRVYCISGGAGVGKTTVPRMLAQMIVSPQGTACFMSISGRATRYIAEALGPELANRCTVKTVTGYLHSLLENYPAIHPRG